MVSDQLDEISETPDAGPDFGLEEVSAASPPPPPPGSTRGFPQLHRFMWGGVIVLVGTLLPFGSAVVTSMYEVPEKQMASTDSGQDRKAMLDDLAANLSREVPIDAQALAEPAGFSMPAVRGYETFTGAVFLILALMLIGQMRTAIQERKVALGAVLLMFLPAGWAWFKFITLTGKMEWFSFGDLYRVSAFEQLTLEVGSGFMLVLLGSTYVVFGFFRALFGAATGGKKPATATAAAGRGRSSRRR